MSRLETSGAEIRKKLLSGNIYNANKEYNSSHKNAISDGDEKGKGEVGGSVGGKTDIETINKLKSKGRGVYSNGSEYNASNA